MESLAECLATQDEIHGKYETLRQTLSEPLMSEVEHLKNLAIRLCEEEAIILEAGDLPANANLRFPHIFNALYQILEASDLTQAEKLTEEEVCYLASLSLPQKFLCDYFKIAILNEFPKLESFLLTTDSSLKINPEWLLDAIKTQKINVVKRICDVCDHKRILQVREHASKEINNYLCYRLFYVPEDIPINIEMTPETFSEGYQLKFDRFFTPMNR